MTLPGFTLFYMELVQSRNAVSVLMHHFAIACLASMLWFGWSGFNGGSALSAGTNAGMAILVTHISAAMAAIVWMVIELDQIW